MTKGKRTKGQTMVHKILHDKAKRTPLKPGKLVYHTHALYFLTETIDN